MRCRGSAGPRAGGRPSPAARVWRCLGRAVAAPAARRLRRAEPGRTGKQSSKSGGGEASEMTSEASVSGDVRDLLPSFRERAQRTEDARRVPDESIKALAEAGYF